MTAEVAWSTLRNSTIRQFVGRPLEQLGVLGDLPVAKSFAPGDPNLPAGAVYANALFEPIAKGDALWFRVLTLNESGDLVIRSAASSVTSHFAADGRSPRTRRALERLLRAMLEDARAEPDATRAGASGRSRSLSAVQPGHRLFGDADRVDWLLSRMAECERQRLGLPSGRMPSRSDLDHAMEGEAQSHGH